MLSWKRCLNCTVLFVLCYAAQHVTKLGWTFIYFSFFPFIWAYVGTRSRFLSLSKGKCSHKNVFEQMSPFPCSILHIVLQLLASTWNKIYRVLFCAGKPCVLSKGCFCIPSLCLWHQNLSLGVPVAFNNGICIDRQYLCNALITCVR